MAFSIEEKEVKIFQAASIEKISIKNINGDVSIRGRDIDSIKIVAFKYLDAYNRKDAEHAIKDLKVKYSIKNGQLNIEVERPSSFSFGILNWLFGGVKSSSVYFEITIPTWMNITLSTINGDLELRNIKGRLNAKTINGKIKAYGVSNNSNLKSVNGFVRVIVDDMDGNEVDVSTVNGTIEIMIDPELGFEFDGKTVNGSIHSDFPIEKSGKYTGRKAHYVHKNGRIKIHSKAINGTIRLLEL